MIRDLLEATRADSGKLRVEPRCVDMGELIQQAVRYDAAAAAEKRVAWTLWVILPFGALDTGGGTLSLPCRRFLSQSSAESRRSERCSVPLDQRSAEDSS
jgi:signal transduction histidine kinase